jgi:hypothetical protein
VLAHVIPSKISLEPAGIAFSPEWGDKDVLKGNHYLLGLPPALPEEKEEVK